MEAGGQAAIGFQMSAEKKVPGALSVIVVSSPLSKSTPGSLHPTPLRQSSLQSLVFSSEFSGPARPHLGLCSEPCPPACLSSSRSHPPSPPGFQSAPDRHVLFPPLSLSDLLSQPDQQTRFSHPPCPVSQLLSPFCTCCPVSWFLNCQSQAPKPPLLPPHLPPPPFLYLLPFPKLLLLVTSHPLRSLSFLPLTDTTHSWTGKKIPRFPHL